VKPSDFPNPHPLPISDIAPTLANHLLACQLRAGFLRDPEHGHWKRPNTYTVLGLVAHAVIEAVSKNRHWPSDSTTFEKALQEIWDREIARGVADLARAWSPAIPPAPSEWPGYMLTRSRTFRRAMKLRIPPTSQPRSGSSFATEVEFRDPDSGLFGRIDRIERNGASIRVIDLKTGIHQGDPTQEQRRQLLLYAVLVHRTTDKWPASIAIEGTSGCCYNEQLDPEEAETVLDEVLAGVASFNEAAAAGTLVAEARAEPDRCRWCDFRVVCRPFWEKLTSDWEQRSAFGSIVKTGESPGGSFVSFVLESPQDQTGTMLHIAGLPRPLLADAKKIAITDWRGVAGAGNGRARWSTITRTW